MTEHRLTAPAAERNRHAICAVLSRHLQHRRELGGDVLEIGAGTGQHAITFAQALPQFTFWPTEPQPRHRQSIDAWRSGGGCSGAAVENMHPAQALDVLADDWGLGAAGMAPATGLVCINVIHISPWGVALNLLTRARSHIADDGILFLYGPYMRGGEHTATSNAGFDASLRAQDPAWGVRDMGEIESLADKNGLALDRIIDMPANNFSLIFSPHSS